MSTYDSCCCRCFYMFPLKGMIDTNVILNHELELLNNFHGYLRRNAEPNLKLSEQRSAGLHSALSTSALRPYPKKRPQCCAQMDLCTTLRLLPDARISASIKFRKRQILTGYESKRFSLLFIDAGLFHKILGNPNGCVTVQAHF